MPQHRNVISKRKTTNIPRINIVLLIVGTRGDVQPFIALGQALVAAGHRVRLATHNTFRKFVRGNGLEFFPLAGDPADLMAFMVKNSGIIPSVGSIAAGDLTKNRNVLTEILASTWSACTLDDDETGESFTAEAIIANPPSFGHVHCAQKLQIPLHIMFTMPWSPTTAFPHPLINVDYSKASIEKVNMLSYTAIEMFTWSSMRDIVNNFRREVLSLPPLHTRQATFMMIDERVPYTYCWSPSLVPKPKDWADHINVSGFFILKQDTTADTNYPDDLLKFLGLKNANKSEKLSPPIYIGFGSITGHDSERLLKIVLEALEQTGCRALLSGLAKDNDQLPETVVKIGSVPHDWLFQHVSAVCHHGGAGTTAAGLLAGKPTIIVPFFGDQFFWGNVVEKNGAGPHPVPGKVLTTEDLVKAIEFVRRPETNAAAERIRNSMLKENGCDEAVRAFHAHLPLSTIRSDLESTDAACYQLKDHRLQVSRRVAQVLLIGKRIDESQLESHPTRQWLSIYDNRIHIPFHGIIKHTQKAIVTIVIDTSSGIKQAIHCDTWQSGTRTVCEGIAKGLGKGIGHLCIGCVSLYGELTDVLDAAPAYYDFYNEQELRSRPYVVDFNSGVNAAILAVYYGWTDGVKELLETPRIGYGRHGPIGGAAGTLIGLVNGLLKPVVGTLSSLTWLCRGFYASFNNSLLNNKDDEADVANTIDLDLSTLNLAQNNLQDEQSVSEAATLAASKTGFKPSTCEQILSKFDRIKQQYSTTTAHDHQS
ncbi:unnamed protein product [Adineta ricciae]|uniref:Glycosyltransferase family 28 N-terminal domain-containing protein n=1 Tax=Adineta ricciae TaxID=249248 RepID=A0A814PDL6_ADIRI|nr:unnamed protein product [Adineta ricciae]CAF1610287.1 unnamed protein product [Adineta ricciae]